MGFQTQCCVLLLTYITIAAGVPVSSKNGDTAVSSTCSPCRFPKNVAKECIFKIMARNPKTGEMCPYCINLCKSSITRKAGKIIPGARTTSKTALENVPVQTNSVVATKSEQHHITKKSNTKTKTVKKTKRRSSRRRKSKKTSRKSKSKSTSGKVTSKMQVNEQKKDKVQNNAATGKQPLLTQSKGMSKPASVQIAYGESKPAKMLPLVRSSIAAASRDRVRKTPQVQSRGSRVRSIGLQPTDSYANEPLIRSNSRGISRLSGSKYRSNIRYGGRNFERSYNADPSMPEPNYNQAGHRGGYTNPPGAGVRNGFYDNNHGGYYANREDDRNNDRGNGYLNDDGYQYNERYFRGDNSDNSNDRSDENSSRRESFENMSGTANIIPNNSLYSGSSSDESNNIYASNNNFDNGSGESFENRSNGSDDDSDEKR